MIDSIKARMGRDDEQGFTLIELMVVVLIIAILLAIAIPTFLSARNSANARGAQADLRTALTAEQTYWTDNQSFSATTTTMQGVETNLSWIGTPPDATAVANSVAPFLGTSTTAGDTVFLMSFGKDNKCYIVQQVNDPNWAPKIATGYAVVKGACPAAPAGTQTPTAPVAGKASQNVVASAAAWPGAGTWYAGW